MSDPQTPPQGVPLPYPQGGSDTLCVGPPMMNTYSKYFFIFNVFVQWLSVFAHLGAWNRKVLECHIFCLRIPRHYGWEVMTWGMHDPVLHRYPTDPHRSWVCYRYILLLYYETEILKIGWIPVGWRLKEGALWVPQYKGKRHLFDLVGGEVLKLGSSLGRRASYLSSTYSWKRIQDIL